MVSVSKETLNLIKRLVQDLASAVEKLPEDKNTLNIEDVRHILIEKSLAGHTETIKNLIKSYGAEKLSDIDPLKYQDLINKAREIT